MEDERLKQLSNDLFKLTLTVNRRTINPMSMFKSAELPPSHIKVIFYLKIKGSQNITDIAKHLDISKPNMTPIIDKLLQDGFVVREYCEEDRRRISVKLTEEGHSFFNQKQEMLKEALCVKLSTLDDDDLFLLEESITNILKVINKLEEVKCK